MMRPRYLEDPISGDLPSKMVFLAGPRQVGKTTLARRVLDRFGAGLCLTRDRREDRREIRKARWPAGRALIVLDEEDVERRRVGLYHLRDADGREVDFLVTHDRKPWFAVEAKVAGRDVSPALRYYRTRIGIPWAYLVVLDSSRDFVEDGVRCVPAHAFLGALV